MNQLTKLRRYSRWTVAAGIVAAVGGVLAASIPAGATVPTLPQRTVAQLLAAVDSDASMPPLSGTVEETASLGIPALPTAPGTSSLPSLLAGTHTMNVWYSDQSHYRIAIPQTMSESDIIRNGGSAWLWESSANQATQFPLTADSDTPSVPLTPQQAAAQALANLGPTTIVRVDSNVTIAGQAAYQLVLVPKSSHSMIGEVRIAIDSTRDVPLRVQVFAKGTTSPELQVAYTAISFAKPPASTFTFSPPARAKVVQENTGTSDKGTGQTPANGAGQSSDGLLSGASVIGSGWLAVLDLPSSTVSGITGGPSSSALGSLEHSTHSGVQSPSGADTGSPDLDLSGIFTALLKAAKPVSGSWGSGHLLQTDLLSVLFTSDGRVLIGAVTPDVLYQAVGQHGSAPATGAQQSAVRAKS
jgi:outer membrane lipoprotein-sorting protein